MNTTPPDDTEERATHFKTEAAQYRCVCGNSLPVDSEEGGTCASCGRAYSATAANDVSMATIAMPSTGGGGMTPPGNAEHDRSGDVLEHFRIIDRIGRGGMGTVYRALDESLQRYVALKVIRTGGQGEDDSTHIERLLQEARAQARVNHANVVHIYFVSRDRKSPFLAMELVGGPTLAARLKQGPLPFGDVVRIGIQVAAALKQAADYDIVHGDIKPSNILLAEGRDVKLSDFGLARRLSAEGNDDTLIGGTPNYLSPEAARGQPTDVRSDMYSLGVMLFEMTFGRLPYSYDGTSVQERLEKHSVAEVEFPDPWPDDIPEGWEDLLRRLLSKSPDERFPDYNQLIAALEKLRPVSLPKAGRLVRALAWWTDLMLGMGISGILQISLIAALYLIQGSLSSETIQQIITAGFHAVIPFLAILAQYRWQSTPGRRLFQIRVVDHHGLPPPGRSLVPRTIIRMLPFWTSSVVLFGELMGIEMVRLIVSTLGTVVLLADGGCALFHRRGLAIHDIILRTRVVLDAGRDRNGRESRV